MMACELESKITLAPEDVAQMLKYVDGDDMEVRIGQEHLTNLGVQLRIPSEVMLDSNSQFKDNPANLKFATLIIELWFKYDVNPTWSTLVEALKKVDEGVIAKEVIERVKSGSMASAISSVPSISPVSGDSGCSLSSPVNGNAGNFDTEDISSLFSL